MQPRTSRRDFVRLDLPEGGLAMALGDGAPRACCVRW
jgi:hypothetical protein